MARARASKGLNPSEDAYGQIYLAVLEGRGAQEIMERDDGLIYCGDPSDYFAPYRRWPSVERKTMRYVRGRGLDVGCGAGRVSLHLQEQGHEVVAIDESPLAIKVVKRRRRGSPRPRASPAPRRRVPGRPADAPERALSRNQPSLAGGSRA